MYFLYGGGMNKCYIERNALSIWDFVRTCISLRLKRIHKDNTVNFVTRCQYKINTRSVFIRKRVCLANSSNIAKYKLFFCAHSPSITAPVTNISIKYNARSVKPFGINVYTIHFNINILFCF